MSLREDLSLRVSDLRIAFPGRASQSGFAVSATDISIPQGTICGIAGPSGSGKTTLLHALGGLLPITQGQVEWGGHSLHAMSEPARDAWRRRWMGFVFQEFHLVPELDALSNVLLPVSFAAWRPSAEQVTQARLLLQQVGKPDPRRRVALLSRGEQQRVAIARALLGNPPAILADEPTASLDGTTADLVADLLIQSARAAQATLIVVTHDRALLDRMDVVHEMHKGLLA